MTATALNLPGVQIAAMPRAEPLAAHWLADARWRFDRALWSPYIGFALRRATAIADPVDRAARYARMREAFRSVEAKHAMLMEAAVLGLRVERAWPSGPALSRIAGPGWRDDALLLYVPGGSFVVERSPQFTAMIARIARAAEVDALVCDYRLSPEHPAPAAIEDVVAAFAVLAAQGIAANRVIVVAESAGACIALAAAQRMTARGEAPGGLALLSPWVDCNPASAQLDAASRQCARLYLAGADPCDPAINPAHGVMRGLPPIAIHANRGDPLFADAELLARRAAAAGTRVDLRLWPGRMHVLERHDSADARRSVAELATFVRRQLVPLRDVG
ncbi:MAG: alpha/beta hydrolase fold domain-containing protein [Sphingopyxis sp.]|nr:alpha/beta hydrolase fold domain-containing protein [Sphingopyxis sp.]